MATKAITSTSTHLCKCKSPLLAFNFSQHISSSSSFSSSQTLQDSLKSAIQAKTYHQIPNLLLTSQNPNPNPFSFLSSLSHSRYTQIIDEILQSFLPLRPRSRLLPSYSHLLSFTFQSPNPLPLSLAILQSILRSGCLPVAQTRLSLSCAWLHRRSQCLHSVTDILSDMRSIGYRPDNGTCNYLISSLCAVDQIEESIGVLKNMGKVGCRPDSESYGAVIGALCRVRKTEKVVELVGEMVEDGLVVRPGTVVKVVGSMRANGEVRKAVEMVEMLEREGISVGFEGYEMVVEGCLERREFVLAGKMVVAMVERGFIPYIKVRQRVVEGLSGVGEAKLAGLVRQKLAEVRS